MKNALYLVATLVALALLGGAYKYAEGQGYDACRAENAAATQELQDKLDRVSKKAAAAADAYLAERAKVADLVQELTDEAMQDPNAGRPAFGADSLRRINRIR